MTFTREARARVWAPLVRRARGAYRVGTTADEAVTAAGRLGAAGCRVTLCYWDLGTEDAAVVHEQYRAALAGLASGDAGGYLSVKAPALAMDAGRVRELAAEVAEAGVPLHFDAMGHEVVDDTWRLIDAALDGGADVGCTLPGRWRRSTADAERAVERGLQVRLVKGQWAADGSDPDPRAGVVALAGLLAGRAARVAVAGHDMATVVPALDHLREAETPCWLEQLVGLPVRGTLPWARRAGVDVGVYLPFGHGWLPYAVAEARRRPEVLRWAMADVLRGPSRADAWVTAVAP